MRPRRAVNALLVGTALAAASWALLMADSTALGFTAVMAIGVPWLIWRRAWLAAGLLLLLNPCSVTFTLAMLSYARGEAHLRGAGLPGTESWNLRPDLRVHRISGGCVVYPSREVWMGSHNAGVRTAIAVFGPMPGAYLGPYPTREETLAAVDRGEPLDHEMLAHDTIAIADRRIDLQPGVGRAMLKCYWLAYSTWVDQPGPASWADEATRIDAAVVDWPAVVVRIAFTDPSHTGMYRGVGDARSGVLVLIDGERGRPFACYEYGQGEAWGHGGPPWFIFWPERAKP